ncbi:MAG: HNH endonuclease [Clostridia bacterium]|nr:HNH endonuclease [Clostridia bacterium]
MTVKYWTRDEEIIVFNLYCKIPFQKSSKSHPDIIAIAKLIGRTPSSVNMKIGNFGSFDETLKKKGIVGLANASKLDKEIWDEFNGKWDELAYRSEKLIAQLQYKPIEDIINVDSIPLGAERTATIKQRVNQSFFRNTVLSSYASTCCITGLNTTSLLIASHIKPWRKSSDTEKTNPCNGLCLNALHDKAFDKGLITITTDYTIRVSRKITDIYDGKTVEKFFDYYNGKQIILPEKFVPKKEFIEYHNDVIFQG